jgi:uncharacterized protein YegJ (DUF2314 family)
VGGVVRHQYLEETASYFIFGDKEPRLLANVEFGGTVTDANDCDITVDWYLVSNGDRILLNGPINALLKFLSDEGAIPTEDELDARFKALHCPLAAKDRLVSSMPATMSI